MTPLDFLADPDWDPGLPEPTRNVEPTVEGSRYPTARDGAPDIEHFSIEVSVDMDRPDVIEKLYHALKRWRETGIVETYKVVGCPAP